MQCATSSSRVGVGAGGGLHDGGDRAPPPLVGHADHEHVGHRRVAVEHALDLLGVDLLAAGVDRRRPAAEQLHGAVLGDGGEVAGDQPALAVVGEERGGRLLGVVVVPERAGGRR